MFMLLVGVLIGFMLIPIIFILVVVGVSLADRIEASSKLKHEERMLKEFARLIYEIENINDVNISSSLSIFSRTHYSLCATLHSEAGSKSMCWSDGRSPAFCVSFCIPMLKNICKEYNLVHPDDEINKEV